MLIPSHRHTPEDLILWQQLERVDKMRRVSEYKLQRSLDAIREFSKQPCYCSVSWGKDSVVVAHLVATLAPRVPMAWIRLDAADNPDCIAVRDAFLSQFPHVRYEEVIHEGDVPASGRLRSGAKILDRTYGSRITGVRADESYTRLMRMARWGESTNNTLAPLGWWTFADVMSYLAAENLPVHPAYAMLGGGRWPRERLRVASIGGERGSGGGRSEWEREYYGDVLNRLA